AVSPWGSWAVMAAVRLGRLEEARELANAELSASRRFGAPRAVGIALFAAGARPRRPATTGVDALTPGEQRVAAMAAAGMSNREIAEDLFVTVKAVQWHLRNVYRKLDVSGRNELPAALGE